MHGESGFVLTICSSILWGNTPNEIQASPGAAVVVNYSDVQHGWPGTRNIDIDPEFVDPDGGDFHLSPGSPCIDTGDPDFEPTLGETDIDGQLRVWDGDGDREAIVDMGSDEFGSFTVRDLNCDGEINAFDIEPFLLALFNPSDYRFAFPDCDLIVADINGDGTVDAFDIEPFLDLLFP